MSEKESEDYLREYIKNIEFSPGFWDEVVKQIEKEDKEYKAMCKRMKIDPISGRSTMSWEERNKPFNM